MTNNQGQILLLSALAACACLIVLAACLHSINASFTIESPAVQREAFDNVLWVQDAGLTQAAGEAGSSRWEQRTYLADSYKSRACLPVSSVERNMLSRGIAYSFTFNESLALKYLNESDTPSIESIDGILIKRTGDNASVCGCAYDTSLADGSSRYQLSAVKIWA